MGTGISQEDYNAQVNRASNAETEAATAREEADDAKLELEKSRRPPDDQIQLCAECKDSDFNQKLASSLDNRHLHVAVLALAGAGKSSLFNNGVRCLAGVNIPAVRSVGAGNVAGGQHSIIISRTNVFEEYFPNWDSALGNFFFTETVGFKGDANEQLAIGKGLLKLNEIWPRGQDGEDILKCSEILKRDPQAPHVTTWLLLISLQDLWNTSDENDNIIKGIIETAKTKFEINGMPVEVPVMIAITKCDEHTTNPHFNNLLGQRNSDNLAPIFKKATERFGLPQDNIIALGWQDESDQTDWSHGSQDPRAMVVRHTLSRLVTSAKTCHRRFVALGHKCSFQTRRDVSPPRQQQARNANDDNEVQDDEQSFDLPSASQVGGGSASMVSGAASLSQSVLQRRTQDAAFERQVSESGSSRKEFVSQLSCSDLTAVLNGKAVATSIIDAILGEGYTGDVFVEDEFITEGFDADVMTKYKINKLVMRSFVKIRDALLA